MENKQTPPSSWLEKSFFSNPTLNPWTLGFGLILLIGIVTRLYHLGDRVMSHDEINHVYFAWQFFRGGDYIHHPLSHGPLQFHLLSFAYFLFNDTDIAARLPSVFFSIATIALMWKYQRYLGRAGAVIAAAFFVISPFMLYYGRYARNDAIAIFFSAATVWTVLRFLDTGNNRYLYLMVAALSLHLATKETAFIFTAQLLLFLGVLFIFRVTQMPREKSSFRQFFLISIIFVVLLLGAAMLVNYFSHAAPPDSPGVGEPGTDILPADGAETETGSAISPWVYYLLAGAGVIFIAAIVILVVGFTWSKLVKERAFTLMILPLTFIFPQLAGLPMAVFDIKWDAYGSPEDIRNIALVVVPMLLVSILIGLLWDRRRWLVSAGIFYAIFVIFHTSIFSNITGLYTGLVGSLGYWVEQQGVERGSQPWYYYILVEIPMYEFLAAIGAILTAIWGAVWFGRRLFTQDRIPFVEDRETGELSPRAGRVIAIALFLFLTYTALIAYRIAGEKMPWLTVHMTWSMWIATAWLVGRIFDKIDWRHFKTHDGFLSIGLIFLVCVSLTGVIFSWPFPSNSASGLELSEYGSSSAFILSAIVFVTSTFVLIRALRAWRFGQFFRILALCFFGLLSILTTRAAIMASYINYDYATEFLVYAHGAHGPMEIYKQVEEISSRITGGKNLKVAYDNEAQYPFWWYFRDYPNQLNFGESPTRELRDYPIILVGQTNYPKVEPIVAQAYVYYEYQRMIWPNQDYFNLEFYKGYLDNPDDPSLRGAMLNALWQIWLNRNYQQYAEVTGNGLSIENWAPSNSMRMYIRKDIAAQIWDYGLTGEDTEIVADPYEEKLLDISPAMTFVDLNLNGPKDIAVASDGSLYLADTGNNRILHLSPEGALLQQWGTGGTGDSQFNQPWGLAVDSSGSVYVADTWNHRIQKFTSDGEFIRAWGIFGQEGDPYQFYGPRDIAIDQAGNVLVSDTGNKRILVYTDQGEYLRQFGVSGTLLGQFNEPVGLAISPVTGNLFVADTWNQRIQVFEPNADGQYSPTTSWPFIGWYGQSLDNKPYLAVDNQNRLFAADPELSRVVIFSDRGDVLASIGSFDQPEVLGIVGSLAPDEFGGLWIVDSRQNRLVYFILPPLE